MGCIAIGWSGIAVTMHQILFYPSMGSLALGLGMSTCMEYCRLSYLPVTPVTFYCALVNKTLMEDGQRHG